MEERSYWNFTRKLVQAYIVGFMTMVGVGALALSLPQWEKPKQIAAFLPVGTTAILSVVLMVGIPVFILCWLIGIVLYHRHITNMFVWVGTALCMSVIAAYLVMPSEVVILSILYAIGALSGSIFLARQLQKDDMHVAVEDVPVHGRGTAHID